MARLALLLLVCSVLAVAADQEDRLQEEYSKLVKGGIVPNIVAPFQPHFSLQLRFDNLLSVEYGNQLRREDVLNTPYIRVRGAAGLKNNRLYTLLEVDPDAPTPAAPQTTILHYLVTNIPGDTEVYNITTVGRTIQAYAPPNPPAGSAPHRYTFFLLEQAGPITVPVPASRRDFDTKGFLARYNLKVVAGNFMRVARTEPTPAAPQLSQDIVALATAAKATGYLNTLLALLRLTGLDEVLSKAPDAPATILAPIDEAFLKVEKATMDALLAEPGYTTLKTVLSYHVVTKFYTPETFKAAARSGASLPTAAGVPLPSSLAGDTIVLGKSAGPVIAAKVIDGAVIDPNVLSVAFIDQVLIPPV